MGKAPLRGCSVMEMPDGTIVPVSDYDGNLLIDQALWKECQEKMLQNVGRTVETLIRAHPERKAAFGIPEGQAHAVLSLTDVLGIKKAPDSAGTTDECKDK